MFIAAIYCEGTPTRQDLKNAAKISRVLKNDNNSPSNNIKYNPPAEPDRRNGYTVEKHILKPGETLPDLAVLYDTDLQSICQANGITNRDELKPGQVVLIPIKNKDQN